MKRRKTKERMQENRNWAAEREARVAAIPSGQPRPEWMSDSSKLPKRPPTRPA